MRSLTPPSSRRCALPQSPPAEGAVGGAGKETKGMPLARGRRARPGAGKLPQTIGLQRVKQHLGSFLTFPRRFGRLCAVMQEALSDIKAGAGEGSRNLFRGMGQARNGARTAQRTVPTGEVKMRNADWGKPPRAPRPQRAAVAGIAGAWGGAKSRPRSGRSNVEIFA